MRVAGWLGESREAFGSTFILNPENPWKMNKNKTVEIDAPREAEQNKNQFKHLFQSRQVVQ
jgi:hypothetical protein